MVQHLLAETDAGPPALDIGARAGHHGGQIAQLDIVGACLDLTGQGVVEGGQDALRLVLLELAGVQERPPRGSVPHLLRRAGVDAAQALGLDQLYGPHLGLEILGAGR